MNIEEKAMHFAVKAHEGQLRKSDPEKPMIIHPINVANILKSYNFDENVIAAGYLHDVVEDTKYTLEDIEKVFGSDITSLVSGATEPDKSLSWEVRKEDTIHRVKNLDIRHKAIICADKISNLEDMKILFEKNQNYDFSAFKRGFEQQKWYYQEVLKSIMLEEVHPMFERLEDLIASVFEGKSEFAFVKNEIFLGNDERFSILKKLHYKKQELIKLKEIIKTPKPYVIEFTGTPRTGKTSIIHNLEDFFKKGGFQVQILEEFTTSKEYKEKIYPLLKDQYKSIVNQEIPKYVLEKLIRTLEGNCEIILVDRCLVDRLIWVERLYEKEGMKEEEYIAYKEKYLPLIQKNENMVIGLFTDAMTALKRDYHCHLSLESRHFLTKENLDEFNQAFDQTEKVINSVSFPFYRIDTTASSIEDVSVQVAEKILDDMRVNYVEQVKVKLKEINK